MLSTLICTISPVRVSYGWGPGLSLIQVFVFSYLACTLPFLQLYIVVWMNGWVPGLWSWWERGKSRCGSVYSQNPFDCPWGSISSLSVDRIWVKKNLGLVVTQSSYWYKFFQMLLSGGWGLAVSPPWLRSTLLVDYFREIAEHLYTKADLTIDLWF